MRRKITFLTFCLVSSLRFSAQQVVFSDSFETCANFAITTNTNNCGWTFNDTDQSSDVHLITEARFTNNPGQVVSQDTRRSFIVFNPANAVFTNPLNRPAFQALSGQKYLANIANYGAALNNDRLISPQIRLGATGNRITFWTKEVRQGGPAMNSEMNVKIAVVGVNVFNTISASPIQTVANDINANVWTEHNIDIPSQYNNQHVYIEINVARSTYFLMIDNFSVTTNNVLSDNSIVDKEQDIMLYPNPTSSQFNYKVKEEFDGESEYSIIDCSGRIVKKGSAKSEGQLDVKDLEKGVYIFQLKNKDKSLTRRIIKE